MAEGGNFFYEHSSGQRPSISSSGDQPVLDGSFLLQLLQRKPHGASVTSSSSQSLRPYQESADAGFPLLPHSLLSPPKLSPASSQPGLHFGESLPLSPPSWAPHHFSPPDGGNQHLPGGQQFFHMDHKRLGFPQSGVSPPNFPPPNSNLGRIFPRSHHDGVLSSNQVGNLGGKVSDHRAQEGRASMRPPPGFGKGVFDGPAEFNRKVEGGAHSQIGSNGYHKQWRSHSRSEWRPSHYEEGRNSTFKMMDKSHLHNAIAERHNEKHNSGKILDGDLQYQRSDGFTNYKEKQTYSDFSGIPILNKRDFMGEKVDGKFDRNLEDYDVEKQANRILEEVLRDDIGEVSSTKVTSIEEDLLCKHLTSALRDSLECSKVTKLINSRDKDVRSDSSRGHHVSGQRVRIRRRELRRRSNIDNFSSSFLHIFKYLVPSEDEITKQEQLLFSLKKLVNKEWPDAELHLYGSCANSFGVSNSDIDICLAIKDYEISKLDILLKLADILESSNLLNVQALTRARVPIVKMMDPVTGISCDICINNLLAVVNTKLLKDYAQIDERLRQLAFIVKHWAKSRRVNETYQGTLSSYAYVLMCIHFLQTRDPAILPCLQDMEVTHKVIVDDTECAYFDQVEKLRNFGSRNKESIAQLIWAFFHYWAYHHDYTNNVISVRTGSIISKQAKDWTRRIGNDRHLICIEDPFEVSHDLGRVVDKFSIKILREEFERAADILQYDPNPTVALFEPYVPPTSST